MSTNKHAAIRYQVLDNCFSNFQRRFFMEDLVEACNHALYEYAGIQDGVKRRQIFDDITFMESDQGWAIPLDRLRDGKRAYYRYADKSFSIRNQTISDAEKKQLQDSLFILSRFKGMPQFEWIEETIVRLESSFGKKMEGGNTVEFQQNPYLKGLHYFADLFNAVHYKKVLRVTYQGYKQEKPDTYELHPYFLKQYNNRWFLFGQNRQLKKMSNLAIDRIQAIEEVSTPFIENSEVDFHEYFEDVVGVTVPDGQPAEKIILHVHHDRWPYIESKPIHGSQKVKAKEPDHVVIELEVVINYELVSTLIALGEDVVVVQPPALVSTFKEKVKKLYENYF